MDSSYNDRKELVAQTGSPKINLTELLKVMGRGAMRKGWISVPWECGLLHWGLTNQECLLQTHIPAFSLF